MKSQQKRYALLAVVFVVLALAGCRDEAAVSPDKISTRSGDQQVGPVGSELAEPLRVKVEGPHKPGLLGGKGSRRLAGGVEVTFSIANPRSGAQLTGPAKVTTDAGGLASVGLKLGLVPGDCYVNASVETHDGTETVTFRATSGVALEGSGQEAKSGTRLPGPLVFEMKNIDGPMQGLKVFFRVEGDAHGAKVSPEVAVTDENGRAETKLTVGKKTGVYIVSAEAVDPEGKLNIRGMKFRAVAINRIQFFTVLIGGLALFVFGIMQMSDGLQHVAGNRLRSVLQFLTKNRFVGVGVGALVTGAIQSSSACTIMVVGFVNAGLITLQQAIGVILGANIGTTITGQLISFKLTDLAYPAIALGFLLRLLGRKRSMRFWGQTLMGFGLLFLGFTILGGTLKPMRDSEWFKSFFLSFDCTPIEGIMPVGAVIKAILVGTALTVLIQSSSATVGLTMALAGSGLINLYTAVPIILGDNIGTTITAILASLGANRTSKQAACAHTLFNALGAAYMFALFYVRVGGQPVFLRLVDYITDGQGLLLNNPENIERHIAMAHSLFNVVNVVIFLPLVTPLAALCKRIVPGDKREGEAQLQYLEPHLLNAPALAVDQAINEVAYMTSQSGKAIRRALDAFMDASLEDEEKIRRREENIDKLQAQITDYVVALSQRELTEAQSRMIPVILHCVNDAERVGDHAENLLELTETRISKDIQFSEVGEQELKDLYAIVEQQFENVYNALRNRDPEAANRAIENEAQINDMDAELGRNHVKRIEQGECQPAAGVVFLDLVANFEKVGDHLTNIAQRAIILIRESSGEDKD